MELVGLQGPDWGSEYQNSSCPEDCHEEALSLRRTWYQWP